MFLLSLKTVSYSIACGARNILSPERKIVSILPAAAEGRRPPHRASWGVFDHAKRVYMLCSTQIQRQRLPAWPRHVTRRF
ncbi:MAG: hypothetical protein ACU0A4_00590 [Paracoccaceae bacterium]